MSNYARSARTVQIKIRHVVLIGGNGHAVDTCVMKLNANFSQRALVLSEQEPWIASPLPGVERRLLDRIGEEVARAPSIVRDAPDRFFSPHPHGGGAEFLVLDGIFSDEHGDYLPGAYVRNPVGSSHKPYSKDGCTIFVKLWQMEPADQDFVRLDSASAGWQPGPADGIEHLPLFARDPEEVMTLRFAPGAQLANQSYPGGAEFLVLDGELIDEAGRYPKGAWLRLPPGSGQTAWSDSGCRLYRKTGHLKDPLGADL